MNTQEKMSEKWRPILGVEAVLVSVLSMLSDPNFESPANIDASVELRNNPKGIQSANTQTRSRQSRRALNAHTAHIASLYHWLSLSLHTTAVSDRTDTDMTCSYISV